MMIPLVSLVASASATGAALLMCSSNRSAPTRKPNTSEKSVKSTKSKRSSKSGHSSSGTASSKSRRSKRHGKSSKSQRKSSKVSEKKKTGSGSEKETEKKDGAKKEDGKSRKSDRKSKSKSKKSSSSRSKKRQRDSSSSAASSASSATSSDWPKHSKDQKHSGSAESNLNSGEEKILKAVPNDSRYMFSERQVKTSTLRPSPNKLPFAPTGGVQTVTIANSTQSRKAFKVKTSDNLLYRVNPVYGFVDANGQMSIDVLRHNGEKKTDNLVVLTSNATSGETCPKAVFESDTNRELTVIPLVAH